MSQFTVQNLRFRCYNPADKNLRKLRVPRRDIPKPKIEIDTEIIKMNNGQIDLATLAPKRSCIDLKRDIKLEIEELDDQTEQALKKFLENNN
jgi:hypothetical protein